MARVGLSGRPILVVFAADEASLTRLRALEHLSPVVVPATALVAGDLVSSLVASELWQIFQNGDDAALTVSAGSPGSGPDRAPGEQEITGWLAQTVDRVLRGAGEAVDLVLAGDSIADAVLARLDVQGGTSLGESTASAQLMRASGSPFSFVRLDRTDPDRLVSSVERLRTLDPDRLALRPY